MTTFERESIEFQPVTVTLDGQPADTAALAFAITPQGTRPTTFTPPTIIGGKPGVMVQGLPVGNHTIWAKATSSPEIPIMACGYITVT